MDLDTFKPTFLIQIEGQDLSKDITQEITSFVFTDNEEELDVLELSVTDRNLQFVIRRDADDPIAVRLFGGGVKTGDAITVWGPVGRFVLDEGTHPLVFVACDTGFAPIKSLIEHAMSLDSAPSMALFWLATRPDGHFLANQCRAWSEALDPFESTLLEHADAATGASQVATAIRADQFDIDCDYYIAGPQAFVQTLLQDLASAGVAAERLHAEVLP